MRICPSLVMASQNHWDPACKTGGDRSVVECWTHDWKVTGLIPGRRIFFSRVNFLFWLLFWYPFHPRVTTVAHWKGSSMCYCGNTGVEQPCTNQNSAKKCRQQVTARHTCTQPMRLQIKWHCKLVCGCTVDTECALVSHGISHVTTKQCQSHLDIRHLHCHMTVPDSGLLS